ncbi:glycosyltransferase family 4 protein [bacterium]|nr:glycosyltransferase family 4 protein [bacterium]
MQLILSGWFANEAIEQQFRRAAAEVCPSIRLIVVDGRKQEIRGEIWNAADVFTSLSDNIQETFGLTPIEAMAAGLPSVISDWDGYRDTVRHQIDGFRISTTIAPAGDGEIFIRRHFNGVDDYDRYIGHVSHFVAVNIPLAIDAYVALCENPALRAEMGEAARKRAREAFHWRQIVRQYQELLSELAERRQQHQKANSPTKKGHPLGSDPFRLFAEYATTQLRLTSQLAFNTAMSDEDLVRCFQSPYLFYMKHPDLMASIDECRRIIESLHCRPMAVSELTSSFPPNRQEVIQRSIAWLLKVGFLRTS